MFTFKIVLISIKTDLSASLIYGLIDLEPYETFHTQRNTNRNLADWAQQLRSVCKRGGAQAPGKHEGLLARALAAFNKKVLSVYGA